MANPLPLHERHVAAGATLEAVSDWELPVAYGAPADEYKRARHDVGLVDRGHFGILELTGRDRATFLHALVSNEVKALSPGQGCAATLLDVHGKVQVVLVVWVVADRIFVVTPPAMARKTAEAPKIWDALVAAGARPLGLVAFESLRIEAGTPVFGHDVDESVLLPEIPFANLASESKGCYPGQEVVVRIRDRGHVNRVLRGLVLEGDQVAPSGAEVIADGAPVGRVTSATWSFGLGRPIALAFLRRQHAEPGSAVSVRLGERAVAANVSALPFTR